MLRLYCRQSATISYLSKNQFELFLPFVVTVPHEAPVPGVPDEALLATHGTGQRVPQLHVQSELPLSQPKIVQTRNLLLLILYSSNYLMFAYYPTHRDKGFLSKKNNKIKEKSLL